MQGENQLMINEEKLLKRMKRRATEVIERVESGLYDEVYNYRKREIENLYSDENEIVARKAALRMLEQMKVEDMATYQKAKEFLNRLKQPEKNSTTIEVAMSN